MKLINPYRLFHGVWLPEWLDNRPEISDGAKRLYARLCCFAGNKGEAFPSYRKLAEKLQKSRRQTIRLMEELCQHELINVTHVRNEVRGNRANIYRFMWHPWMQLKEDKNYALIKTDFNRPPSDIHVTTPGDTRVTSPSVKNVTHKRIIYKERGRRERNQTLFCAQLPPSPKVFKGKLNDIQNADPWKLAEDAVESFKRRKLYPRECENIISDVPKLSLCAKNKEALALKWFIKTARRASLGLPLPLQQRVPLDVLSSQEKATVAEQSKLKELASNSQTEEKRLAANSLQTQTPAETSSPTKLMNTANHKRGQRWINRFAQSALSLRSCKRLLAKCSFAKVMAGFNRIVQTPRLAYEKGSLCIGKAIPQQVVRTSLDPLLTKPSSPWKVSWFVSTQDSKIVDNFAPSHFLLQLFRKIGRLFRSSSELQRKEIKENYANI
jgi:hypothetical protein